MMEDRKVLQEIVDFIRGLILDSQMSKSGTNFLRLSKKLSQMRSRFCLSHLTLFS